MPASCPICVAVQGSSGHGEVFQICTSGVRSAFAVIHTERPELLTQPHGPKARKLGN